MVPYLAAGVHPGLITLIILAGCTKVGVVAAGIVVLFPRRSSAR
jgi:hypothetical protein